MRWMDRRRSTNVEDRRAFSPGGLAVGGGLGTLAIIVISLLLGGDPRVILDQLPGNTQVGIQEGGGTVPDKASRPRCGGSNAVPLFACPL